MILGTICSQDHDDRKGDGVMMKSKYPLVIVGEGGEKVVQWKNFLKLENWKIGMYDLFLVILFVGLALIYRHDVGVCNDIQENFCELCSGSACFVEGSCEIVGSYDNPFDSDEVVIDGGLGNFSIGGGG